jgi:hypothetical protein
MKTTLSAAGRSAARILATAAVLLAAGAASAATVRLLPVISSVQVGATLQLEIRADIDSSEAIIGFGFDLDTSSLAFQLLGFAAGPGFADDPVYLGPFSDADGIRAASGGDLFFGPAVSGTDILLGTLEMRALQLGSYSIGLGADDLAFNFTEGLIPLSVGQSNFMPVVTPVTVEVTQGTGQVPIPGTLALAALGVALLGKSGNSGKKKHSKRERR